MQQHLMQMQPMMAAYYSNNVTSDHIQQYLDENKSLILKIVESQNSGKLSECAENQARLQRNLMYLAAIADSQPQPQFPQASMIQSGPTYMHQQQEAQSMTPQAYMATPRSSMLYSPHQHPYPALSGHISMSTGAGGSGLHMVQTEPHGSGNSRAGCSGDGGESPYLKSHEGGN